jgi:SDR family mycofactocin-dependent oxidoreductase
MTGRLEGKVAFVTGAARGQGRSHAVRLASEGAHTVICDACGPVDGNMIRASSQEDLEETARQIEGLGNGSKVLFRKVDVRDGDALTQLAADAVEAFGGIDIVVANAGILNFAEFADYTTEMFTACLDTNLTGTFNTVKATVPHMIAAGRGGSIILISSSAGIKGQPFTPGYTASKHGVVGLMKGLANELGEHSIRVNTIHPAGVETPMTDVPGLMEIISKYATTLGPVFMNSLPIDLMQPRETSNAVAFLASDEAQCITGLEMKVDLGTTIR